MSDTVVVPEIFQDVLNQASSYCRTVSIVLNPLYIFQCPLQIADSAITNSPYTRDIFEKLGTPTKLFTTAVRKEFYPEPKELRVCWFPRKTDHQIESFKNVLASIDKRFISDIEWYPIVNLSDEDFAKTIRRSLVFLSLSLSEGWCGAMYEAMRCRTLVCCYPIAQPYLVNVVSAETGNYVDLAMNLAPYLRLALDGTESRLTESLLDRAYQESLPYTAVTEAASIIQMWRDYLEGVAA